MRIYSVLHICIYTELYIYTHIYNVTYMLCMYVCIYIHTCILSILRFLILVPLFVQVGWAQLSPVIFPGGWRSFEAHDHPSKRLISWGSSSRALKRHSLGLSENMWCPQFHCLTIFLPQLEPVRGSHFQTQSLHAAERWLFCGRNCLCKSLGRKHVAWGATREKVCGESTVHVTIH